MRYIWRFRRIFGRISIHLKNRFDPGKEFFNRIGRNEPLSLVRFPPQPCPELRAW
jgi:hypothetical protein